eukprot:gene13643-15694_t
MLLVAPIGLISDLPSDVVVKILSKWLSMKSVARVDSALCCRETRSTLLDVFASNPFATKEIVRISNIKFMRWLCLRKIRLVHIELNEYFPGLSEYLRFSAPTIRNIGCTDFRNINTIAIYCRELTSLNLNNTSATENLNALLHFNPNLQSLQIDFLNDFEPSFEVQHQKLSQLKSLSLYCSSFDDAKLMNLIEGVSSLQQLDLSLSHEITDNGVMTVIRNCPLLRSFGACCVKLSDIPLIKLSESCPLLMHLDLSEND